MFIQLLDVSFPFPHNFVLHTPQMTGRFGEINSMGFETIAKIARQEGFLTDPIYSAKLFIESKRLLANGEILGNVLIHHSGGSLTLMGFQNQLKKV